VVGTFTAKVTGAVFAFLFNILLARISVEQALNVMHDKGLIYYNFHCPKCKNTNRVL